MVTVLFTRAALENALLRRGAARLVLSARENIVVVVERNEGWRTTGSNNLSTKLRSEDCWIVGLTSYQANLGLASLKASPISRGHSPKLTTVEFFFTLRIITYDPDFEAFILVKDQGHTIVRSG